MVHLAKVDLNWHLSPIGQSIILFFVFFPGASTIFSLKKIDESSIRNELKWKVLCTPAVDFLIDR